MWQTIVEDKLYHMTTLNVYITGYVEISDPTRRSEFDYIYWTPIQNQDG